MRLKALDQISLSAVKSDSLRPGEEFDVSDGYGSELLKQHPTKFEQVGKSERHVPEPADEKAEAAPLNKAESAPANKAATERKKRGKG